MASFEGLEDIGASLARTQRSETRSAAPVERLSSEHSAVSDCTPCVSPFCSSRVLSGVGIAVVERRADWYEHLQSARAALAEDDVEAAFPELLAVDSIVADIPARYSLWRRSRPGVAIEAPRSATFATTRPWASPAR
jgi:hypothetical protein